MPTVRVDDGVEIYYEEYGSGDNYLLCYQVGHGLYSLEKEMAKRGFHVYLLTNQGFGRSTHVTEDYGDHWYDRFADDVVAFADAMGIETFTYSGGSHGAGTGWHVALRHPERMKCFFAVVPGPHNLDESGVSVRQQITCEKESEICLHFMTCEKPELNDGICVGGTKLAYDTNLFTASVEKFNYKNDPKIFAAWGDEIYSVTLTAHAKELDSTFTVCAN